MHFDILLYFPHWDAFKEVLPKERHIVGKQGTYTIKQDNSNPRHHLARFTRRTKVVSKTPEMINLSLKLSIGLMRVNQFKRMQDIALDIFR
ncbi:IS1 family transposase [Entomospira culicis]|uniref:IS1 family transposase n=1 Tax=Entomospira culicis TaxID=2719989 RepID=A0A968GH02_9SPIO|nr:IS1 family transposase [Entomospira culicis]NIZ69661.1 IS1 family transposase [Entomospira culicis]